MNCLDALELATATIDGEVDDGERTRLDAHLSLCNVCRVALELERMTRSVIRTRLHTVRAPARLVQGIKNQIAAEHRVEKAAIPFYRRFFASPRRIGIAAAGAIAVVAVLLLYNPFSSHLHSQPLDGDVIHQTLNNFDKFRDGRMEPEIRSNNPQAVQAFFAKNASFSANVPPLNSSKLLGGGCSQYKQAGIAHVIYEREGELIYVYQTTLRSVEEGSSLQIAPDILAELKRGGKYIKSHASKCTLIVWLVDSTVCCAIADIHKDQLLASLQENY